MKEKKIVMIIARRDFRDEEYFIPKNVFETEGLEVRTAGMAVGQAVGSYGGVGEIDLLLEDVNVSDFDVILFVGGSGALEFLENRECHRIAKEAVEQKKLLTAICIAPSILATAGVLKNKKATVWSSNMDKFGIKILKENGAKYLAKPVVIDGKVITANSPESARKFAETIIRSLEG